MSAPATSSSDLSAAWRSASAPLTLAYTVLVVYASLYPFEGWVDLGVPIFDFVLQPDAKMIGVMGAFRDLDRARWREVRPLEVGKINTITVTYGARQIRIDQKAEPIKEK